MTPETPPPQTPDPPLPTRAFPVTRMSTDEARKATLMVAGIGAIVLIAGVVLWFYSGFCAGVAGFIGIALIIGSFAKKSLITRCPFCTAKIGGILAKGPSQIVRCSSCFEYSIVESGRTRALDPNLKSDEPRYWCPAFEGAAWPAGCVECGAPATRHDAIRDSSLNVAALAIGTVWITRASLGNLPYCDSHKDAVQLSYSQTKKMDLRWKSLRMMRRYLAANRGKTVLGSKTVLNP